LITLFKVPLNNPLTLYVLQSTLGWWVTNATLGIAGLAGGIIILALPETNNMPLCETVEDVEFRYNERKRRKKDKADGTKTNGKTGKSVDDSLASEDPSDVDKKPDSQIIKEILLNNSFKFTPKSSIRAAVMANKTSSNSINNLLEQSDNLTTNSFGIKEAPALDEGKTSDDTALNVTVSGVDNEAYEKDATRSPFYPQIINNDKNV